MKSIRISLLTLLVLSVFAVSCKDDEPADPIIPNEEEVITTLRYILTPENGGDSVVFSFQDLDGDLGEPPIFINGVLDTNTTYNGRLELLNELENPAENISDEVREEAEEHQFFFESAASDVVVEYNDADLNGNPIGLSTKLTTGSMSSTSLKITLRHEPAKEASGVKEGDITNAGGETDIEVSFDVEVR